MHVRLKIDFDRLEPPRVAKIEGSWQMGDERGVFEGTRQMTWKASASRVDKLGTGLAVLRWQARTLKENEPRSVPEIRGNRDSPLGQIAVSVWSIFKDYGKARHKRAWLYRVFGPLPAGITPATSLGDPERLSVAHGFMAVTGTENEATVRLVTEYLPGEDISLLHKGKALDNGQLGTLLCKLGLAEDPVGTPEAGGSGVEQYVRSVFAERPYGIIGRPHLLELLLASQQFHSSHLAPHHVEPDLLERRLKELLARVRHTPGTTGARLSLTAQQVSTRAEELRLSGFQTDVTDCLWQALAEDHARLLNSPPQGLSAADQHWLAFVRSVPGLSSALQLWTPYLSDEGDE